MGMNLQREDPFLFGTFRKVNQLGTGKFSLASSVWFGLLRD